LSAGALEEAYFRGVILRRCLRTRRGSMFAPPFLELSFEVGQDEFFGCAGDLACDSEGNNLLS
jgi:hypothetical protein